MLLDHVIVLIIGSSPAAIIVAVFVVTVFVVGDKGNACGGWGGA